MVNLSSVQQSGGAHKLQHNLNHSCHPASWLLLNWMVGTAALCWKILRDAAINLVVSD